MNANTTHLQARAKALRMPGLLAHWDSLAATAGSVGLDCAVAG